MLRLTGIALILGAALWLLIGSLGVSICGCKGVSIYVLYCGKGRSARFPVRFSHSRAPSD